LLTPNELNFWIVIWAYELAVLSVILVMNSNRKPNLAILPPIGLYLVVFGTFLHLVFTLSLFTLNESTTQCMINQIGMDPINGDKLWECYTTNNDLKWTYFMFSIIMSMIIVFGTVLQAYSWMKKK